MLRRGEIYRWSPITRAGYIERGTFTNMLRQGEFDFFDTDMELCRLKFKDNVPISLIKDYSKDQRFKDIVKDYKSYGIYSMFLKQRDKINQVIDYIKERIGDRQDEIDLEKVCKDLDGIYVSYETRIAMQEIFNRTQWQYVIVNNIQFDDLLEENLDKAYDAKFDKEQKYDSRDVYSGLLESQEQLIR